MRQERNNIFFNLDWTLILLYILLVTFGWINIYAASNKGGFTWDFLNFSTEYGKQVIWIGLSIPLIITILFFNARFYEKFSSIFYLIGMILLLGVIVFGKKINGATSWYAIGSISFQPSEIAKVCTALGLAKL